jgi:hypothetical protein
MSYILYRKHKKPKAILTGKLCKKCKTFKPIDDFYKNKKARDGHQTYCKDCHLADVKATPSYKKALKRSNP